MSQGPEALNIRLFGAEDDSAVDAEVLARILMGMQRAVYVIAMDKNNLAPASPNYVPQSIQNGFPVRCLVPQQGSYALPLQVGNPDDLTIPEEASNVVQSIVACLKGLVSGDQEPYTQIRNGRHRMRLLDAFRTMLPKPGANWKLGVSRPRSDEITLTGDCVGNISSLKERLRQQQALTQTITGSLQAMDFKAHKITILYPENNRELDCFYDEELEPELWETRRDLVQVTGTVVVDAEGLPTKIQDVETIEPVDLTEFELREVPTPKAILRLRTPIRLVPELTESKQYMVLRHAEYGIDVVAPTREELLSELHEQVEFLWREFALEDESCLSPSASALKSRLTAAFEEVPISE